MTKADPKPRIHPNAGGVRASMMQRLDHRLKYLPYIFRCAVNTADYSAHGFLYPMAHQNGIELLKVIRSRPASSIIRTIWVAVKRCSRRVPKRSNASVRIV